MKAIKADHHRRIDIPGVPEPVSRPVDIDQSKIGFEKLRSLRIYRFDAGSVIDGHAEEDEVLILVLSGSVELTLADANSAASSPSFTLSAATIAPGQLCAAYLPPHGAYRLTAHKAAEVAYARATPFSGAPPCVFRSKAKPDRAGIALLWEEAAYPRMLRVRLTEAKAEQDALAFSPIQENEASYEALIHIRTVPEEGAATITGTGESAASLSSWDTVPVSPGERPTIQVAIGSSALILVIVAHKAAE